jgi:hypothetical protein
MSDQAHEDLTVEIPESLDGLSLDQLTQLRTDALEAARALYDPDADDPVEPETAEALESLAAGVDRVDAELADRREKQEKSREAAKAAMARLQPAPEPDPEPEPQAQADPEPETETVPEPEAQTETVPEPAVEQAPEPVAAAATKVTVAAARRRRPPEPEPVAAPAGPVIIASGDTGRPGEQVTLDQIADAWSQQARSITAGSLRTMRQQRVIGLGAVQVDIPDDLKVGNGRTADEVLTAATNPDRLKKQGGSLTAASWCSPSEVLYQLADEASTLDGLVSFPTIGVDRGGIQHTLGFSFAQVDAAIESFDYSEAEVADGDYDGAGGGTKPSVYVPCPEFHDDRLRAAGLWIKSGLLPEATYPEVGRQFISEALKAHAFVQGGRQLAVVRAGSTVVNGVADAGFAAGLLGTLELQAIDYRQRHKLGLNVLLEVKLPVWTQGAVRADLSRRLGVDLLSVPDSRIAGWFAERNLAVQFVYGLDDLDGDAADRVEYPATVDALLYRAGTWVAGTKGVVNLQAVYDSVGLEQNEFTKLFVEEGWLVAQRWHDSRVITLPVCPDGATHGGILIDCDGSDPATVSSPT